MRLRVSVALAIGRRMRITFGRTWPVSLLALRGTVWISVVLASAFLLHGKSLSGTAKGEVLAPRLEGTVVDASRGAPVAGAVVNISGPRPSHRMVSLRSDATGRFAVEGLGVGTYSMTVNASGYLSAGYGQRWHGGPTRLLEVRSEPAVFNVRMHLVQAAAVEGRLTDARGEPIVGANVRLVSFGPDGTQIDASRPVRSNDRGEYRFYGLAPGRYTIGVIQQYSTALSTNQDTWALEPAPESLGVERTEAGDRIFLSTFLGGAARISAATQFTLAPGENRFGADLVVASSPFVHVAGYISANTAMPLRAILTLVPREERRERYIVDRPVAMTQSDGNGYFVLDGVPPGAYTLRALVRARRGTDSGPVERPDGRGGFLIGGRVAGFLPLSDAAPGYWAETSVDIDRETSSVKDVSMVVVRGAALSGRVILGGEWSDSPDVAALRQSVINLEPLEPGGAILRAQVDPETLEFRFPALPPSSFYLYPSSLPGHVYSIGTSDGPLFPAVIDGRAPPSGLAVGLAERQSWLRGAVRNVAGGTNSALVLIFPEDRRAWEVPKRSSSQFQALEVSPSGSFESSALQPGSYLVVALTNPFLPSDWRDAGALSELAALSGRVELKRGGPSAVTLAAVLWRQ